MGFDPNSLDNWAGRIEQQIKETHDVVQQLVTVIKEQNGSVRDMALRLNTVEATCGKRLESCKEHFANLETADRRHCETHKEGKIELVEAQKRRLAWKYVIATSVLSLFVGTCLYFLAKYG